MANPLPIPLSLQFPSAISGSGVFLANLRGFLAETLGTDWYYHGAAWATAVFPGQGTFTPLPPGPVGIEWVNASGATGTLNILETDTGEEASSFFRRETIVFPAAPTRQVVIPTGKTARIILDGVKKHLAVIWVCNPAVNASGTLRSLVDLRNAPSNVVPGTYTGHPGNNGN